MNFHKVSDSTFDDYLANKPDDNIKDVFLKIRQVVHETVPEATEILSPWKLPTFMCHGQMFYLSLCNTHVSVGFAKGTSLPDPDHLLEGIGKNQRHVKVRSVDEASNANLRALILAAAKLNEQADAVRKS